MEYYAEEIRELKDHVEYIRHIGTDHLHPGEYSRTGSGRYSYGSGKNPYQHEENFLNDIKSLKEKGMSEDQIRESYGMSTREWRAAKQYAENKYKLKQVAKARELIETKGYSNTQAAKELGVTEGTIRYWIKNDWLPNKSQVFKTIDILNDAMKEKGMIDVGRGVNVEMGVSDQTLSTALKAIEKEGKYHVVTMFQPQATNPDQKTSIKVLCPNEIEDESDLFPVRHEIKTITDYANTSEKGKTLFGIHFPQAIDSKRICVRYDEEGGSARDGVVELRPGVKDLSLGSSAYSQVRINVDNTHYIKGMAIYSDDIPKGYDILVNSNKAKGTPLKSDDPDAKQVLKTLHKDKSGNVDKDNPFKSLIKTDGQSFYQDSKGEYIKDPSNEMGFKKAKDISKVDPKDRYSLSAINKIREEGEWEKWSKSLSSQFLSKQPVDLIKKQLDLDIANKKLEFEEIKSIKNPEIKRKCMFDFAEKCDKSAVELKAAPLPRQNTKVILPVTTLKDDEIYAPGYRNGENVALIRYPHQGTFEIPILKVNNKHKDASKIIGPTAVDAVGININVAEKLSGADFDGDTVLVIPTLKGNGVNGVHIKSTRSLDELKGFDPKKVYKGYKGMKVMDKATKEREMGITTNLLTDMTLQGAPPEDIVKVVRHCLTVIDAEKHQLDWKTSEADNDIPAMHKKYQGRVKGGASTIVSKASGSYKVPQYKEEKYIVDENGNKKKLYFDPVTGEKYRTYTGKRKAKREKYIDENGKTKWRDAKDKDGNVIYELVKQESTHMKETNDARTLVSKGRYPQELLYANYANTLKSMANKTRLATMDIGKTERDSRAAKVYANEVASLNAQIKMSKLNSPRERQAQLLADKIVINKRKTNDWDKEELKKARNQAILYARDMMGAKSKNSKVKITEKEWQAIEAGAISSSMINDIIKFADQDRLKELAMPKKKTTLSKSQISVMKQMKLTGYTIEEIAKRLGVSTSTVSKNIKEV